MNVYTQEYSEDLFNKIVSRYFYKHTCEYCKKDNIIDQSPTDDQHSIHEPTIERILFEPQTEEQEFVWYDANGKRHAEMKMTTWSSNPHNDIIRYKCPICGHINEVTVGELLYHPCAFDGKQHKIFVLSEEETKAARAFMEEHDHSEEFADQGKVMFTTLGQQFTYEITPGGLGNTVSIKCNQCKESKDITNIDEW